MAKTKASSLELLDVRVKYNPSNGSIKLTSKDPELNGLPFAVTLSSDTPSSRSLLQLLKNHGLVSAEADTALPDVKDVRPVDLYSPDKPHLYWIGANGLGNVALDLSENTSAALFGAAGTGKSVALNSIIEQAASNPDTRVSYYSSRPSVYGPDFKGNRSSDLYQLNFMFDQILNSFSKTGPRHEVIFLENMEDLFMGRPSEGELRDQLVTKLESILSLSKRFSVRTVMVWQSPAADCGFGRLRSLIDTKVLFGAAQEMPTRLVFGEPSRYGLGSLGVGVGVLKSQNDSQTIFKTFISDADRDPRRRN